MSLRHASQRVHDGAEDPARLPDPVRQVRDEAAVMGGWSQHHVNHHATFESRSKGGKAAGEAARARRARAREIAEEVWADNIRKAAQKHVDLLDAEAEAVALAAVKEFYDRELGKTTQAVEFSGEDGGPMQIVVRSAFELDSGDPPALPGDTAAERPGESVD